MSASSNTMNGALPPSSSDMRLTVGAHCAARMRPVSVEPVKLSLRTSGWLVSSPPMARESPVTTLHTPAGTPARAASSAMASADSGVCIAGLTMIVQPAASAGATLRVIIAGGKFQGRDGRADAARLTRDDDARIGPGRGDRLAVDAPRLLGKPLDEGGRVSDLP